MKLLMVSSEFPPDRQNGSAVAFSELYQQAREHSNVRLISGWNRARSLVPPEAVAVDISGLSSPKRNLRILQTIQQEIRQWKPDILLSNGPSSFIGRTRSIVLMHGSNIYEPPQRLGKIKTSLLGKLLSQNNRLLCNDKTQAEHLTKMGVPSHKI